MVNAGNGEYKTKVKYWLLFPLLIINSAIGVAQEPLFKNFSIDNGLPSNEVYNVQQDTKGYIWFATDFGVCRYDGNKFKYYTTREGLCDNTVFLITEDQKGRIWFYTFSGKISYFYNDSIYNIAQNRSITGTLKTDKANSMYVDKGDTIWLGLKNVDCVYKIYSNDKYGFVKNDAKGDLLIKIFDSTHAILGSREYQNTGHFIDIYKGNKHIQIPMKSNAKAWANHYFLQFHDGTYAVGINNTLTLFNEQGVIATKTFEKNILCVYEENNSIWVGFRNGGIIKIGNKNDLTKYEGPYLTSKSITHMLKDKEGGYWFSTLESGIYYTPSFTFFSYTTANSSMSGNNIIGITGRKNGEVFFSQSNNEIYYIKRKSIHHLDIKSPHQTQQIAKALYVDKNDNLWIGWGDSTLLLTKNSKTFKILKNRNSTKTFYEDNDRTLWLGNIFGLSKFKHFVNELHRFNDSLNATATLRVECICEQQDSLYLGSLDGVWTYHAKKYAYLGNKYPLFKNRVVDIKKDKWGRLWFGTRGAGVLMKDGGHIYQITEKDGLIGDFCNAIYINDDQVWVATNRGLSIIKQADFITKKHQIDNYTKTNGLISNQINSIYRQGNDVWLATSQGLNVFDVTTLKHNDTPPPIYINRVLIDEIKQSDRQQHFELRYTQNNILIDYEGLSYKNAGKIPYRYKLEGVDNNWTYTYNTSVKYTELPHGKYVFEVEAANNDGVWSTKTAKIKFNIHPAFYQTFWFMLILIVFSIAFIWFLFYVYYNRIREKEYLNQRVIESEQKALRSQMNPHFIFNSLNSIQRFIMKNDKLTSSTYLSKFSNLMRAILENSQSSYIPLSEELQSLQLYLELESLRFENKFIYSIEIDQAINSRYVNVPTMLFQPFVENAIKHGLSSNELKGTIKIIIKKQGDHGIACIIEDNGVGREKAAENKLSNHKSLGQKITRERIDLLNIKRTKKITLEIIDLVAAPNIPCGTQVKIYIP